MKIQYDLLFAILLLGLSISPAIAQNQQTVPQLEQRIKQLEAQNQLLQDKLEFKQTALDTAYAQKLKSIEQKISDDSSFMRLAISIIVAGSFLAIAGVFFSVWAGARNLADKKIGQILGTKGHVISSLIKDYEKDVTLRKRKQITILHADGADTSLLVAYFTESGYKGPKHTAIDAYEPSENDDLILFFDLKKELDLAQIQSIAEKSNPKTFCFYFGPQRVIPPTNAVERFSFANAISQLHTNIMNALHFQDVLAGR